MNLKPALAASILFGLWASVSAQITPNSDRHLIRLKFEKGQTIAYDLTTTISIGGRKINQDQDLKIEILNLLQKDAHVKITSPDPVTSAPNSTDVVLNTRGIPTDGSSIGLGIIQLPTGAVKAGSSWQQERSLTDFMLASSLDVSSTFTLQKVRKHVDTLVADFTEKATFKGDSLSGTGSGQGLIDGNDGFLRFYQLSATLDITIQDQPTRITMTIKLARRKKK